MKISTKMFCLLFSVLASGFALAGTVNINTADANALATGLTGVGEAKATSIIAYRELHGPFESANDLQQVKGIGQRLVDMNRDVITVRSGTGDSQ